MLGKPEWFDIRKYGGWGLTPKSWQGWAYILAIVLPLGLASILPIADNIKTGLMLGWAILFSVDFIDIMIHLKKDERDSIHEALAERNAMWFMVTVLALGAAYQAGRNAVMGIEEMIDPIILIALFGAMIVKGLTHWYLKDK